MVKLPMNTNEESKRGRTLNLGNKLRENAKGDGKIVLWTYLAYNVSTTSQMEKSGSLVNNQLYNIQNRNKPALEINNSSGVSFHWEL